MSSHDSIRITLSGPMGSGVSTAADVLEEVGAQRWSRTELMLRLASAIGPERIGDPDELLERLFPVEEERDQVRMELLRYTIKYEPEAGKPRRLYQEVTDICQGHDPLCFEVELQDRIVAAGEGDVVLVDDVRSRAALEFYGENGYTTIRIEAPEHLRKQRIIAKEGALPASGVLNHPSETDLNGVPHDIVIVNDGTKDELRAKLLAAVAGLGIRPAAEQQQATAG